MPSGAYVRAKPARAVSSEIVALGAGAELLLAKGDMKTAPGGRHLLGLLAKTELRDQIAV